MSVKMRNKRDELMAYCSDFELLALVTQCIKTEFSKRELEMWPAVFWNDGDDDCTGKSLTFTLDRWS